MSEQAKEINYTRHIQDVSLEEERDAKKNRETETSEIVLALVR